MAVETETDSLRYLNDHSGRNFVISSMDMDTATGNIVEIKTYVFGTMYDNGNRQRRT